MLEIFFEIYLIVVAFCLFIPSIVMAMAGSILLGILALDAWQDIRKL